MILFIDATDYKTVAYALSGAGVFKRTYKVDPRQSHQILSKLNDFFKSAKIRTSDISKIIVNKGPGSFTGTRIGVTHTLALGFAWKVPIKALGKDKFLQELKKHTRKP